MRQRRMDGFAIVASLACLVHCLGTPLLILMLPVLASSLLADETFHLLMLLWVVPASCIALWIGCHRHRDAVVLLLGGAGLLIVVAGGFLGERRLGTSGEKLMTMLGSLAIVFAHLRNHRLGRNHASKTTVAGGATK